VSIPETEPIDRVPGDPELSRWRAAARRHQSRYRQVRGWPAGSQRTRDGGARPIGSRVEESFARETGCNFLSPSALRAVEHRLARPERHQMLDERRLWSDLLSSMPLCFNLLGPLWDDAATARDVARAWFPQLVGHMDEVTVRLEWSPGRADTRWTGDRSAFDGALIVNDGQCVIGIETKYHEKAERRKATGPPPPRYVEISEHASLFNDPGALATVWGSSIEQIWRDHLLALACAQNRPGSVGHYALVSPAGNPAWPRLADQYRSLLTAEAADTFSFHTLESLLEVAGSSHPSAGAFNERYLDVDLRG